MTFLYRTAGPFLFPSILWHTSAQSIHLTFDDGPHPVATPAVLKALSRRGIHATFFFLGENIARLPDLAREVVRAGHAVGSHGVTHRSLFLKVKSYQHEQILRGKAIIEEILYEDTRIFRPPFGHFDFQTLSICSSEKIKLVLWDVDMRDFRLKRTGKSVGGAVNRVRQGSVVLFHDNDLTAGSIETMTASILDQLLDRGHQFSLLPS
jgi:peptidoglycan/xylan/chitin deacetylase (PgdA/CDA1 family)